MRAAVDKFSHFPAISELIDLADGMHLKDMGRDRPPSITRKVHVGAQTPWPPSVEGLMLLIKAGGEYKGLQFALRFNGITQEEAWSLWDAYCEKEWRGSETLRILAKVKNAIGRQRLGASVLFNEPPLPSSP